MKLHDDFWDIRTGQRGILDSQNRKTPCFHKHSQTPVQLLLRYIMQEPFEKFQVFFFSKEVKHNFTLQIGKAALN